MENDLRFDILRKRELAYSSELVENITIKSCGVFLWTRIAVASILSGIGHGDRVSDLQDRLDTLPEELEQLYDKILNSLDHFYVEHAAQLFSSLGRAHPHQVHFYCLSRTTRTTGEKQLITH